MTKSQFVSPIQLLNSDEKLLEILALTNDHLEHNDSDARTINEHLRAYRSANPSSAGNGRPNPSKEVIASALKTRGSARLARASWLGGSLSNLRPMTFRFDNRQSRANRAGYRATNPTSGTKIMSLARGASACIPRGCRR